MPVLSGVSSLATFIPLLNELYADGVIVTRNSPTQVLAGNGDVRFAFIGTGLEPVVVSSVLGGFTSGVITSVKIRAADSDTVLASLTGLNIDIAETNALSDGASLLGYFSKQPWTITGTTGADNYNLSNTAGFHTRGTTTVDLRGGNDTATGGLGADRLLGDLGNDTLLDSRGNDVAMGGAGNDMLGLSRSAAGDDTLRGGTGHDTILGGSGRDELFGEAGDDSLDGGAGNDRLSGGSGRDTMKGGLGEDTFVFGTAQGNDLITDFTVGVDTIRVDAASVSIVNVDGDAVIRYDGTRIVVDGIAAADLVIGENVILCEVSAPDRMVKVTVQE